MAVHDALELCQKFQDDKRHFLHTPTELASVSVMRIDSANWRILCRQTYKTIALPLARMRRVIIWPMVEGVCQGHVYRRAPDNYEYDCGARF